MALSHEHAVTHQKRVTALFALYGETLSVQRSGTGRDVVCVTVPMDGGTTGTYFDANEAVGLIRPALTLYVPGTEPDPPTVDDVFFRDGRLYTVRKAHVFRQADVPVLMVALCD